LRQPAPEMRIAQRLKIFRPSAASGVLAGVSEVRIGLSVLAKVVR